MDITREILNKDKISLRELFVDTRINPNRLITSLMSLYKNKRIRPENSSLKPFLDKYLEEPSNSDKLILATIVFLKQ